MNFKRDIQESWTFIIAATIFILLTLLPNGSDILLGIASALLAATLTFSCLKRGIRLQKEGKYWRAFLIIYAAGFLSSLWLYDAINYLI